MQSHINVGNNVRSHLAKEYLCFLVAFVDSASGYYDIFMVCNVLIVLDVLGSIVRRDGCRQRVRSGGAGAGLPRTPRPHADWPFDSRRCKNFIALAMFFYTPE